MTKIPKLKIYELVESHLFSEQRDIYFRISQKDLQYLKVQISEMEVNPLITDVYLIGKDTKRRV